MSFMKKIFPITNGLHGEIKIPGDKSVSHRAVMISSLADKTVEIENFLFGADCLSTVDCMKKMGVDIKISNEKIFVTGRGLHGLCEPSEILDAGNSGTTLRLLLGLTAAQNFFAVFTGDKSLSKRPLARVIKPLSEMGAEIFCRNENKNLPAAVLPKKNLRAINYKMPVASAQVKSAIIFAALYADSVTKIIEPYPSRNHTEKMLSAFGVKIETADNEIKIFPAEKLIAPEKIIVPGDISSAAYWIVLASILKNSEVVIKNVGVNETRTGIIDVMKKMGAKIKFLNVTESGGEKSADIKISSSELHGIEFGGEFIPRLIDEIPALAVAAAFAEGTTIIKNVGELRVKESDRLSAIVEEFNKISPNSFEADADSLIIHGGRKKFFAECKTNSDHRMAMALSIFGAAAEGVLIDDEDCVKISYPNFFKFFDE
ncbi:MAG: 3-phosphoshikimate 1-carboxyvinyltransferase [Selenomonadaceae bacterium]|nr:3-phosphoshikimate 1-carboxyvinyltransferase [Selenomonadaceae bacterium]